jgi:triacylglycerol lipase
MSFNLDDARQLARCAALSYRAEPGYATKNRRVLEVSDNKQACLIENGDRMVLAFRGTDSVADWFRDMELMLSSWTWYPGRVHLGFADRAYELWEFANWASFNHLGRRPLWITGHSLGGAVATLTAVRLRAYGVKLAPMYTFGSPRVGDAAFAKCFPLEHWRVVDGIDLVPHLPVAWPYRHVGQAAVISDHSIGPMTWLQSIKALVVRVKSAGLLKTVSEGLGDHGIDQYVRGLGRVFDCPLTSAA